MAAGFVLGGVFCFVVWWFVFFFFRCPLPASFRALEWCGVMSATLIVSAGGTDDPDVQQQRAVEERGERGGCGTGQAAAAAGREDLQVKHFSVCALLV